MFKFTTIMHYVYFLALFLWAAEVKSVEDEFVCRKRESEPSKGEYLVNEEKLKALEAEIREIKTLLVTEEGGKTQVSKARDCQDLFENGVKKDGVYNISPDGECSFKVFCDMTNGGWTVIQRRQDGTVNFHRGWDAYITGFGEMNGEYWLGLDKIHRLTKDGAQIYFKIVDYAGKVDHAHYQSFTVNDASTLYTMRVDPHGYTGSLPELLSFHDNMKFSTHDRDNDVNSKNCAQELTGGWWYKSCWRLGNLNGVFNKKARGGLSIWIKDEVFKKTSVVKIKKRNTLCK